MQIRSQRHWKRTQLFTAATIVWAGCTNGFDVDDDAAAEVSGVEQALAASRAIPPELAVPSGNYLTAYRKGVGVQIYTCTSTETGAAWALTAPRAELLFPWKHVAGIHYAGPTWEALDGSTVVGARVAGVTVDASAVPWLLLEATAHTGDGRFSNVSFIQRLNTTAGLAPTKACAAENAGEVVEVEYTADYLFYNPLPSWLSRSTTET